MKIEIELFEPASVSANDVSNLGHRGSIDTSEHAVQEPLVSCLMVTRGDTNLIASALYCYRTQTYANRELVIVCDRIGSQLSAMIDELADPSVRLIRVAENRPLGALRNIAVANARGEIICQWDDDDLCSADRLKAGVLALLQTGAAAAFLKRWILWWPARELLAVSAKRAWEGSMIAWRGSTPPYPQIARGEDTALVNEMCRLSRICLIDRPSLYCYVKHSSNTWNDAHFMSLVATSSFIFRYDAALAKLSEFIPFERHRCARPPRSGPPHDETSAASARVAAGERAIRGSIGRNEECPCGSGIRFKHCCGTLV